MSTIETQLKSEILQKYKSIRAFTNEIGIPYSTLDSVFRRGEIGKAGVTTMIAVFDALDLDLESIPTGTLRHKGEKESPEPSADNPGAMNVEYLEEILQRLGYLNEDGDLSEDDLRFLMSIGRMLRVWFESRNRK